MDEKWNQCNASLGLTAEIEVLGIVLVEHRGGYVGHISARITFTS